MAMAIVKLASSGVGYQPPNVSVITCHSSWTKIDRA